MAGLITLLGQARRQLGQRLSRLGPLGLTLGLVVGAVVVLGAAGVSARLRANGQSGAARLPLIARADAHVESLWQGKDLELNVALTQTQNDCQAPLNGGICLRYSVVLDEQGMLAGYGVIPASAVTVTPGAIVLHVDTSKVPGFTQTIGKGQVIAVTWKVAAGHTGSQQRASVQGAVGAYSIPGGAATAGAGASVVATMLVH